MIYSYRDYSLFNAKYNFINALDVITIIHINNLRIDWDKPYKPDMLNIR